MKEILLITFGSLVAMIALGLVLMGMGYPLSVLSCNSETKGMAIQDNEYRFWSDACMVQLKDGTWVPLKNYRSFKEESNAK